MPFIRPETPSIRPNSRHCQLVFHLGEVCLGRHLGPQRGDFRFKSSGIRFGRHFAAQRGDIFPDLGHLIPDLGKIVLCREIGQRMLRQRDDLRLGLLARHAGRFEDLDESEGVDRHLIPS